MASPLGRGAQVRLDGDAQARARGIGATRLIENMEAKAALERAGLFADGSTQDGSTFTGQAAEDEVLAPGGVIEFEGGGSDRGPSLKDFGAIGDNVADDTAAVRAWWLAAMAAGTGYIPVGRYRCDSPLALDVSTVAKSGFVIQGCGTGRSVIDVTRAGADPFLIYNSDGGSFCGTMRDFGVLAATNGVGCRLGRDDLSDGVNSWHLDNIQFKNLVAHADAVALRINRAFASTFNILTNTSGTRTLGTSLQIVSAAFSNFYGSFSGAGTGLHITGSATFGNVFHAPNIEEVDTCLKIDSVNATRNTFLGGQYKGVTMFAATAGLHNIVLNPNFSFYSGGSVGTNLTGISLQRLGDGSVFDGTLPRLSVKPAAGNATMEFSAVGTASIVTNYQRDGVTRWRTRMNDGNNFLFDRFDTAGALVDTPAYMDEGNGRFVTRQPQFQMPAILSTYTSAGLPAASATPRGLTYVSDGADGKRLAYSTGSAWAYLPSDATVQAVADLVTPTLASPHLGLGTLRLWRYPNVSRTAYSHTETAALQANGAAIQAAFDTAAGDNRIVEDYGNVYHYDARRTQTFDGTTRNIGLQAPYGSRGFVGNGADETRLINFAPNHSAFTDADCTNDTAKGTANAVFRDFRTGFGVSQAGQTQAFGYLRGRSYQNSYDGLVLGDRYARAGYDYQPYVGLQEGLGTNMWSFSNRHGVIQVLGGQKHIHRKQANTTGDVYELLYLGGGGPGNRHALIDEALYMDTSGLDAGTFIQVNTEWVQAYRLIRTKARQFNIGHWHIEGVQLYENNPDLVMVEGGALNVVSVGMLNTLFSTATVGGKSASGTVRLFTIYGSGQIVVGGGYGQWSNSGEAIASMPMYLYADKDTSVFDRRPYVEIGPWDMSGNTGAFSMDPTLPQTVKRLQQYRAGPAQSVSEGAIITAPTGADLLLPGGYRNAQVILGGPITAARSVQASDKMANAGIGNSIVQQGPNILDLVRPSSATGAFPWQFKDAAGVVIFSLAPGERKFATLRADGTWAQAS